MANWDAVTAIGTWFSGIITFGTVITTILYSRKQVNLLKMQEEKDREDSINRDNQMAHDVANDFMEKLPKRPELIEPDKLSEVIKDFHYNIKKTKYLINKNNYDSLCRILGRASMWQSSYY